MLLGGGSNRIRALRRSPVTHQCEGLRVTTPVGVFLFKRSDTLREIFARIRAYAPTRLYLLADGPRSEDEARATESTRLLAESLVDWECEVVRRYQIDNVGVYRNIGEGAKWVLAREETCIFLEDDNLPAETFFRYCDELLARYRDDDDVLWICGTNYLQDTSDIGSSSYYYTRLLLPCGWATWSQKFLRDYDGELTSLSESTLDRIKGTYLDRRLYAQERQTIVQTRLSYLRNPRLVSWDRQMAFSIRSKGRFGIAPARNQIRNIGVDEHSIHGGTSLRNPMTARFCEIPTSNLSFPLISPSQRAVTREFEVATESVLLYPLSERVKRQVGRVLKRLLRMNPDDSLSLFLRHRRGKG